jgi:DNA-binding MarR family transcriptional regulator
MSEPGSRRFFGEGSPLTVAQFRAVLLALVRDSDDHTTRQIALLLCLREGPDTVRHLAERMGVTKPAVTRAVDRGEEDRYVERRPDPADRRSVLAALTSSGRRFVDGIERIAHETEDLA